MENEFFKRDTSVARINEAGEIDYNGGTKPGGDDPPAEKPPDLQGLIAENAAGPKRVEGDAGSVEQHSLRDQIAAEKFLQSKKANQGGKFPLSFHRIKPGGTT